MGYSIWIHPQDVLKGFKKGLNNVGVIDLKISKSKLMKIEYDNLIKMTTKEKTAEMGIIEWTKFLFWSLISQIIFLFPLILIIFGIIFLKK